MADTKTSPYRQRVVADNVVPVHEAHGIEAQTCNVAVPRHGGQQGLPRDRMSPMVWIRLHSRM